MNNLRVIREGNNFFVAEMYVDDEDNQEYPLRKVSDYFSNFREAFKALKNLLSVNYV